MPAFRTPAWNTLELLDLLGLWGEEAVQWQLCSCHRNFDIWGRLLEACRRRDTQQCCAKIKELRQAGQKARKANHCFGAAPKTFCFYEELLAILSSEPTSTVKSPVDTLGGQEAAGSRVSPEDDPVDEEVELEEDVGHAIGSSGGMASQDLFLTLEGSSQSQHSGCGVHEAREASSDKQAFCFDTAR
ncbi:hypothetical protein UY3_06664 [Chelonia mydas]|uniref:Zinc finger and SCAN domain-containing protein 29 n=1 Tax=Chelonia mydas TaxID=8469 RepID=M7C6G0_CHEMY|nr:hypothetical protein UY3_06664 [Chelonia mydas]